MAGLSNLNLNTNVFVFFCFLLVVHFGCCRDFCHALCRLSLWAGRQTGSGWWLSSAHSSPRPTIPHSQQGSSVKTRATRSFKNQNAVCAVVVLSRFVRRSVDSWCLNQPPANQCALGGGLAVFQLWAKLQQQILFPFSFYDNSSLNKSISRSMALLEPTVFSWVTNLFCIFFCVAVVGADICIVIFLCVLEINKTVGGIFHFISFKSFGCVSKPSDSKEVKLLLKAAPKCWCQPHP